VQQENRVYWKSANAIALFQVFRASRAGSKCVFNSEAYSRWRREWKISAGNFRETTRVGRLYSRYQRAIQHGAKKAAARPRLIKEKY